MSNQSRQTLLSGARFDDQGVVCYARNGESPVHLVYAVAQQAMLGRYFPARYMEGPISVPYAEFISPELLPSPVNDPVARAAANWLEQNASRLDDGAIVWPHEFEFVYTTGDQPIAAPWVSGVAQANVLLACLHWWKHTNDAQWKSLAAGAAASFNKPLTEFGGISSDIGANACWFEEYPTTTPAHILNCHLLGLIALHHAGRLLDLQGAVEAFERGFESLLRQISFYDLQDGSRYDLHNNFFLLLRLVPSKVGTVAAGRIRLRISDDTRLCELEAAVAESCDQPISRLAGIDWGSVVQVGEKSARLLPNRQASYVNDVPVGGTDQNTYLVFEESSVPSRWMDRGVILDLDLFHDSGAELAVEFRDLRHENLAFRKDDSVIHLRGAGWKRHEIQIAPRLIGRPLPRHYHRLHTELLGCLLEIRPHPALEEVFQRWHRSDFHDIPCISTPTPAPNTIYVFVNDRCGLRCKMCDIGLENRGIDQEVMPSMQAARTPQTDSIAVPILRPSLSLNMTDRAKDLKPEILLQTIEKMGPSARGSLLQLNGTEPLLYPEYSEVLQAAKRAGMLAGITTSGIVLPREARRLAEAGLDQLLLSIDGPPEIHDEIRGVPRLFSRIVEGVEALDTACREMRRARPEIIISFAVTLDNHRHVLAFLDAVRPLRPTSIIFNHLNFVAPQIALRHNTNHPEYPIGPSSVPAWEDCLKMDFLELFRQLEIALRAGWARISIIPHCPTPMRLRWYYHKPHLPMSRARCAAPWASVQVRADGTVAVLARCFDLSLGDLKTQSMDEVWNGSKKKSFAQFLVGRPFLGPCLRCCGSL